MLRRAGFMTCQPLLLMALNFISFIPFISFISAPAIVLAQRPLVDLSGRIVGTTRAEGEGPRLMMVPLDQGVPAGRYISLPAGVLTADRAPDGGAGSRFGVSGTVSMVALFSDGTDGRLPEAEWDAGDVEAADLNGDGAFDIVFSLSSSDCEGIPEDRPRLWMQQPGGTFADETESRLPGVPISTREVDVFDADGDGDPDILMGGYACPSHSTTMALYINDGSGHFAEESAGRIPFFPGLSIVAAAEPGRIMGGPANDLVVILLDTFRPGNPSIRPMLLKNDGAGYFTIDSSGRIATSAPYGFFDLRIADLTGDGLDDILFLNFGDVGRGESGRLALLRNTGNGFMADETVSRMPPSDSLRRSRTAAIDDVDADGDPDILDVGLFYGGNTPQVRLLLNSGSGIFTDDTPPGISSLSGWFNAACLKKFSGGPAPDLFLATVQVGGEAADRFLMNDGSGSFADSSNLLPETVDFTVSAAVGDYENDGDPDIVLGNSGPLINEAGRNSLYIDKLLSPPSGVGDRSGAGDPSGAGSLPGSRRLIGSYPNPFNSTTTIRFRMENAGEAALTVWNMAGELAGRLAERRLPAGLHEAAWDASRFPSGVYQVRLTVDGGRSEFLRVVFVR